MSTTHKIRDHKTGATCGCEYTIEKNGREQITRMCMEHEQEFIVRHASAVASCSHVNRDLTGG